MGHRGYRSVFKDRAAGLKVIYCPEAVAVHCESATLKITKQAMQSAIAGFTGSYGSVLVPVEQDYVRTLKNQASGVLLYLAWGLLSGLARILSENAFRLQHSLPPELKRRANFF